jgi:hypothetical protein
MVLRPCSRVKHLQPQITNVGRSALFFGIRRLMCRDCATAGCKIRRAARLGFLHWDICSCSCFMSYLSSRDTIPNASSFSCLSALPTHTFK